MGFESIHNYYEMLVSTAVRDQLAGSDRASDQDFIDDVTCMALNQLPARYVRHTVDLMFYMTPDERAQMAHAVDDAVKMAIRFVAEHAAPPRPHTFNQADGPA